MLICLLLGPHETKYIYSSAVVPRKGEEIVLPGDHRYYVQIVRHKPGAQSVEIVCGELR